jgi:hypothetical protein
MILERRFRTNPNFELKVFESLEAPEQQRLGALFRGRDAYGVLRARDPHSQAPARLIEPDVALLLLTLTATLPFPQYARAVLGERAERLVQQLVLDGVLETTDDAGRLVTGTEALGLFVDLPRSGNQLVVRLSEEAVRWGSELGILNEGILAGMLYWYNTVPVPRGCASDTSWTRRIQSNVTLRRMYKVDQKPGEWCMCHPLRPLSRGSELAYKLYVSVRGEAVIDAADRLLQVLAEVGQRPLKFGAHRRALGRPDKLVVYFASLQELRELARALSPELSGLPVHGVPFTAPIDEEGRLSWGIDPPAVSDGSEQESWRFRVVTSLAAALTTALRAGTRGESACEYALARSSLDGIDRDTWTPQGSVLVAESRSEV